jgi:hypothetical protein
VVHCGKAKGKDCYRTAVTTSDALMIADDELARMWIEHIVVQIKLMPWHLPSATPKMSVGIVDVPPVNQTGELPKRNHKRSCPLLLFKHVRKLAKSDY